jgi:multiple sugar transport system permease protein
VIYVALCFWAVVCLFPIYWLGITSLKRLEDIDKPPTYLPFVDFQPSLAAWRFILADPYENLISGFVNSLIIGLGTTLITLLVSLTALYGFTRFHRSVRLTTLLSLLFAGALLSAAPLINSPLLLALLLLFFGLTIGLASILVRSQPTIGANGAVALMLATRCLPPVVIVLPLYFMARSTGMYDTRFGMIFVYSAINLPVAIWLLQPAIGSRATEQEEAAQIDGAPHLMILFDVLIPMIRRAIAASGLLIFLLCWNEYLFAAYLTSENAQTLPIWMAEQLSMKEAQTGGEAEEWAHMSAAAILMMIPALSFAAFGMRAIGMAGLRKPR